MQYSVFVMQYVILGYIMQYYIKMHKRTAQKPINARYNITVSYESTVNKNLFFYNFDNTVHVFHLSPPFDFSGSLRLVSTVLADNIFG